MTPPLRYRFDRFVVSPRRRSLTRDEVDVPIIPRYFDLLVLLIERRHEAVHRNDIFARVWSDVVVSDGALAQAVRVLRRLLEDDSRDPRFIRTISRHGYRFVFEDVVEEPDERAPVALAERTEPPAIHAPVAPGAPDSTRPPDVPAPPGAADALEAPPGAMAGDDTGFEALIERLLAPSASDDERRDAAERLLQFDVDRVLARLDGAPGHVRARAVLRDARWNVAGAGPVPLVGQPGTLGAAAVLVAARIRQTWRLAGGRWGMAIAGGGLAGAAVGVVGGCALVLAPHSTTSLPAAVVLGVIGSVAGVVGAAGIAAGLAAAEVIARSWRGLALVAGGALGGGVIAWVANLVAQWTLSSLFSLDVTRIGGLLEGLVIGAAVGAGYAWATPRPEGGMAAPRGAARVKAAAQVALVAGAAAAALALADRALVGGTVNAIAQATLSTQMTLSPLGRLLGEPGFGRVTASLFGALEGAALGFGLTLGLARRTRRG